MPGARPWPRDLVWITAIVVPALALCGATVAVLTLSRTHDRALARMGFA